MEAFRIGNKDGDPSVAFSWLSRTAQVILDRQNIRFGQCRKEGDLADLLQRFESGDDCEHEHASLAGDTDERAASVVLDTLNRITTPEEDIYLCLEL